MGVKRRVDKPRWPTEGPRAPADRFRIRGGRFGSLLSMPNSIHIIKRYREHQGWKRPLDRGFFIKIWTCVVGGHRGGGLCCHPENPLCCRWENPPNLIGYGHAGQHVWDFLEIMGLHDHQVSSEQQEKEKEYFPGCVCKDPYCEGLAHERCCDVATGTCPFFLPLCPSHCRPLPKAQQEGRLQYRFTVSLMISLCNPQTIDIPIWTFSI